MDKLEPYTLDFLHVVRNISYNSKLCVKDCFGEILFYNSVQRFFDDEKQLEFKNHNVKNISWQDDYIQIETIEKY